MDSPIPANMLDQVKTISIHSGPEVVTCDDKRHLPLDQHVVAVVNHNRRGFRESLEEVISFAKSFPVPGLTDIIEKMEKEVVEGEDPRNLFLNYCYILSVATCEKLYFSYEHLLGYFPPATEDELNDDGSVYRTKGQAHIMFLSRTVADYINMQLRKPVRAIVVSRQEMTRLLKEHGYYGGDISHKAQDENEQGVYVAKFPIDTKIVPKETTNSGAKSCSTWEYTVVSNFYMTCKKETGQAMLQYGNFAT